MVSVSVPSMSNMTKCMACNLTRKRMEPAGSGATWTGSPKGVFADRKHHKPRLSLDNNTAGVCEREDVNRTREAGNRDEVEGVVAITPNLDRDGAVGFIDWLDFRALLRDEFIIKFAVAAYHLPAANWTPFYVAIEDVNLAFPDAAVVTGLTICSPVLFLISIANAVEFLASDAEAHLNRVVHHWLINLTRT